MALSPKRQAFVEHYLREWEGKEAAILAGYSKKTARQQASRLLTNVDVQAAIQARLSELKMGADEVLIRLTEQAQGAAQYLIEVKFNSPFMNWERLRDEGKLHLIKKLTYAANGRPQVEFYDAQTALIQLGRHHKLFTDRAEIPGLEALKAYVGISPDDWDEDEDGDGDATAPVAS